MVFAEPLEEEVRPGQTEPVLAVERQALGMVVRVVVAQTGVPLQLV